MIVVSVIRSGRMYKASCTIKDQEFKNPYAGSFSLAIKSLVAIVNKETGVNILEENMDIQVRQKWSLGKTLNN